MPKVEFENTTLDSKEEVEFLLWCREAKQCNIITDYKYHPITFILFDGEKIIYNGKKRSLLTPIKYSPDFEIHFTKEQYEKFKRVFPLAFIYEMGLEIYHKCYIDVKGTFAGRNNTSSVTYPIKRAWLYQKYNIYTQTGMLADRKIKGRIIAEGFFRHTWVPWEVAKDNRKKEFTRVQRFKECKLLSEVEYV